MSQMDGMVFESLCYIENLVLGNEFTVSASGNKRSGKRRTVAVNLTSHSSWLYGDVNAPPFDEPRFELAKWALLSTEV